VAAMVAVLRKRDEQLEAELGARGGKSGPASQVRACVRACVLWFACLVVLLFSCQVRAPSVACLGLCQ